MEKKKNAQFIVVLFFIAEWSSHGPMVGFPAYK